MASSSVPSSTILPNENYEVFLSFRGSDTRNGFTSHLHAALRRKKIKTYIDYELERGDEVGPALLKAIKESKISVIIFSKDYASSTWCLDELACILECKERNGQYVIPIFYEIEPTHVRYQTGSYETAFVKHEQMLKGRINKVHKWKEALTKAANLSGFDSTSRTLGHDSNLVEQVVSDVLVKLNRDSPSNLTGLIGVEERIQKILLELDIIPEDVRVRSVVIWGMGGIGKTTLANAVFHGLSSQFEAHCFLANIRERSGDKGKISHQLYHLRDELLRQLLGDMELAIHTPTMEDFVKKRLNRVKVLIVLDDVNDSSQLEFLAGDQVPFGPGSRIIITTRDMQPVRDMQAVMKAADHDTKIYKVEELSGVESLQFFHSNAPTESIENSEYLDRVLNHAAGVPLALKVLCPMFQQCKRRKELELLWDKLKMFPNKKLQSVYRVSYDELERNEREIFLDIACFHRREKLCHAKQILAACGLYPDDGIRILIDMSLIFLKDDCIWMHDVILEMAIDIVNEECTEDPGNRSRLHNYEDVDHVLHNNTRTSKVQSICLRKSLNRLNLSSRAFTGMHNLRFLMLKSRREDDKADIEFLPNTLKYLFWDKFPLNSFPSDFSPKNLVELHMPFSKLTSLWSRGQNPKKLKTIDLSYSKALFEVTDLSNCVNIEIINLQGCISLVEVPDLSNSVHLESINLLGCVSLVDVPDLSKCLSIERLNLQICSSLVQAPSYIHQFTKLTHLNLGSCSEISILPELPSKIEVLDLHQCSGITDFSSVWKMKSLTHLNLSFTMIESVPSSIESMTGIISLILCCCQCLVSLPTNICMLKYLERIDLTECKSFTYFPEILEFMEHLQCLRLSKTNIHELPFSFGNIVGLKTLDLSWSRVRSLYNQHLFSLCSLTSLSFRCSSLQEIPNCFDCLPALQFLDLSRTMIQTIPPTIEQVSGLKSLKVAGCERLQSLPVLPYLLEKLMASGCKSLKTVAASVSAHTQGLDQVVYGKRTELYKFYGCFLLDEDARRNIMDDAHHRIMRMATALNAGRLSSGEVTIICEKTEIPKWFSCQTEGSSMCIKLPLHWSESNLLGFALCYVSAIGSDGRDMKYQCQMILKTEDGESHSIFRSTVAYEIKEDSMVMWYTEVAPLSDEAKRCTEAFLKIGNKNSVKRCGVCFMYSQGQDDNALMFEVVHP